MSEERTILITGGAGFVGEPTVRRVLDCGYSAVILDNFERGDRQRLEQSIAGRNARIVEGDIRSAADVQAAFDLAEPWGVIHLAAIHFIPYCRAHPAETVATNVLGLQHVLDASANAERLVFISTVDVYKPSLEPHKETDTAEPDNIYGASKLMGEKLVELWRKQGAQTRPVIARLSNVVGPGETNPHVLPDICNYLRESDSLPLGNTTPMRDYVFVEDVAAALVGLLESDLVDTQVNVSTGTSYSVADLVESLARITGRPLTIDSDPAKIRAVDRPVLAVDVTKLRTILPTATSTPLDEALRKLLESESLL